MASPDRYTATGLIKSSMIHADFKGLMRHTDTTLNVKADLEYNVLGSGKQLLALAGDYKATKMGVLNKHDIHLSVNVSVNSIFTILSSACLMNYI